MGWWPSGSPSPRMARSAPVNLISRHLGLPHALLAPAALPYQHVRHYRPHALQNVNLAPSRTVLITTSARPAIQYSPNGMYRPHFGPHSAGRSPTQAVSPGVRHRQKEGLPQATTHSASAQSSSPKSKVSPVQRTASQKRHPPAPATKTRRVVRSAAEVNKPPPPTYGPEHRIHNHVLIPGDTQTLQLPSGAQIGFADIGCRKDVAQIWVCFHGKPGSRLEWDFLSTWAEHHRIRLVCPDRPGYGLSVYDLHKRKNMMEWMQDVNYLVKYIKAREFRVLGVSGGGPYALAATHYFTKARVQRTAIMCGVSYPRFERTSVPLHVKFWGLIARWLPSVRRRQLLQEGYRFRSKNTTDRDVRRDFRLYEEYMRQWPAGWLNDDRTLSWSWGFRLKDVNAKNIMWYHGNFDSNCSEGAARKTVEAIGGTAVIQTFAGLDHFKVQQREWPQLCKWLEDAQE